jgi:predicted enzyme related to lactoylglutathione lyase
LSIRYKIVLSLGIISIQGRAFTIASIVDSSQFSDASHLKNQGVHFRNEMEVGPGGRQIQVEDPDGNLIELFEPARATL